MQLSWRKIFTQRARCEKQGKIKGVFFITLFTNYDDDDEIAYFTVRWKTIELVLSTAPKTSLTGSFFVHKFKTLVHANDFVRRGLVTVVYRPIPKDLVFPTESLSSKEEFRFWRG